MDIRNIKASAFTLSTSSPLPMSVLSFFLPTSFLQSDIHLRIAPVFRGSVSLEVMRNCEKFKKRQNIFIRIVIHHSHLENIASRQ